jgi:hypothetical protein
MRTTCAIVLCALVLSTAGCPGMAKSIAEGKTACNRFYQSRQAGGDLETTLAFYSPKYLANVGKAKVRDMLEAKKETLGDVKSWTYFTDYKFQNKVGTSEPNPGRTVELKLEVTYDRGTAIEEVTMYKPADGSADWLVLAHTIAAKKVSGTFS